MRSMPARREDSEKRGCTSAVIAEVYCQQVARGRPGSQPRLVSSRGTSNPPGGTPGGWRAGRPRAIRLRKHYFRDGREAHAHRLSGDMVAGHEDDVVAHAAVGKVRRHFVAVLHL